MFYNSTPCGLYLRHESRAEIINFSYRMDSAIAPDRHSALGERVDSSSVLAESMRYETFISLHVIRAIYRHRKCKLQNSMRMSVYLPAQGREL